MCITKTNSSEKPGGGGASGGMVAHDLVNGCQATPDGMSEANLQRLHPRRACQKTK